MFLYLLFFVLVKVKGVVEMSCLVFISEKVYLAN